MPLCWKEMGIGWMGRSYRNAEAERTASMLRIPGSALLVDSRAWELSGSLDGCCVNAAG